MTLVDTTIWIDWLRAKDTAPACARWSGLTPRSPHDCLIAAAVAADVPLLHDDRDFEVLARVERRLQLARA